MYKFNGSEIEENRAKGILENFKERYVNESYPQRILFINHLNLIEKKIPTERIRELNISNELDLFMYHERLKVVYITKFEDVCKYVEQLEPWEDIDCLVFDEKLNWYIGITHDDTLLINGL